MTARDLFGPCGEKRCIRERGHAGMHMARWTDRMTGRDVLDEWGDVDADKLRRLMEAMTPAQRRVVETPIRIRPIVRRHHR